MQPSGPEKPAVYSRGSLDLYVLEVVSLWLLWEWQGLNGCSPSDRWPIQWEIVCVRECERASRWGAGKDLAPDEAHSNFAFLTFLYQRMGGGEEGCLRGCVGSEKVISKLDSHCRVCTTIRRQQLGGGVLRKLVLSFCLYVCLVS